MRLDCSLSSRCLCETLFVRRHQIVVSAAAARLCMGRGQAARDIEGSADGAKQAGDW